MYNVLIVDDEQGILDGLKKLIPWNEYSIEEVMVATSGEDALKILNNFHIDILITDVKMDGMSGIELIRRVKSHFPNIKNIIESGYDDFQYVKEGIGLGIENYLLKPVDEEELIGSIVQIQNKIEQDKKEKHQKMLNEDIIRENIFLRWINNNISASELVMKSNTLNISLNDEVYFVVVIGIQIEMSLISEESIYKVQEQNENMDKCIKEFRRLLKDGYIFSNLHNQITIIVHGNENNIEYFKTSIDEIVSKLHKRLDKDFYCVMGDVVFSFHEVSQSYRAAQHLIYIKGRKIVNRLVEWPMNKSTKIDFEKRFLLRFDEIAEKILERDVILTEKIIDRFYDEMYQNRIFGSCWEQIILQQLVMTIISCVDFLDHKELLAEVEDLLLKIQFGEPATQYEKIQTIRKLAIDTIRFLQKKIDNFSPIISEIVNVICEKYSEDLNLTTIAARYKVNPVYLGQLFKNEVGDYFSVYLNNVRIQYAKKYLEQTDISVNKIGINVGYANKTHFYSVFKKFTGLTPTEYRRQLTH